MGPIVLARLIDSQIWHPSAASVVLWGEGSEKVQWPLPTCVSGRKLSPSSRLHARNVSSSLYATDAFQATLLVLELRGSVAE